MAVCNTSAVRSRCGPVSYGFLSGGCGGAAVPAPWFWQLWVLLIIGRADFNLSHSGDEFPEGTVEPTYKLEF